MQRNMVTLTLTILAACGCSTESTPTQTATDAAVDALVVLDTQPPPGDAMIGGTVDVSGGVIYHSMNRLAVEKTGRTPEYSGLLVELVSVGALLTDPLAKALASVPLMSTGCPTMGMCPWSQAGVSLASMTTEGLAVRVLDTRTTGPQWVTTATSAGNAAAVTKLTVAGKWNEGRGFAVSKDAVDAIVAPMVGLSGDVLMTRGFVFGLVYSTPSTGTSSGKAVAGATVAASSSNVKIVYPNNNFSGTGSATGMQGAFLAIPDAVGAAASIHFTVTPPAGETLVWDATQTAVVLPGAIYFLPMSPKT